MELNIYEIVGYTASVIVALSMTMSSIVKFRWINLVGASTFAAYGLLIGAIPVALLNGFIVAVDLFYLNRIYSRNELFEVLEIRGDNKYLLRFLEFHNKDIQRFFPGFTYKQEINTVSFFVLRNMHVAGIFLAHKGSEGALNVGLDYSVPEYRDYKNGKFIYQSLNEEFLLAGYKQIVAPGLSKKHAQYLKRFGFMETGQDVFVKNLNE
jgi:hypothetical protein